MAVEKKMRTRTGRGGHGLLSERLLVVLTREMEALERASKDSIPKTWGDEDGFGSAGPDGVVPAAAKGRIEAATLKTESLIKTIGVWRGLSQPFDKRMTAIELTVDGQ
ncbi:MAG: hypothetical protein H7Y08_01880, partial [Rhizobiaceae bacterium]|nr:hypothetical protein [Rhizobiaceae bacterium]